LRKWFRINMYGHFLQVLILKKLPGGKGTAHPPRIGRKYDSVGIAGLRPNQLNMEARRFT